MASETTTRPSQGSPLRLWFCVSAAFFAWHLAGTAEMFITWRAGLHSETFGNACLDPAASAASFGVTALLLATVVVAGFLSYRSWRTFSPQPKLYEAEGRGRREYMALLGILSSFMLGVGMVWLLLPLFILNYCARVR